MPRIAINFQDGFTRIIQAWDGEVVANAAYRQRVNIPLDCTNGVCGTCKCRVLSGQYSLGTEYLREALSDAEAAEGLALACQMVAKSDLVIDVFATTAACKIQPETFCATITGLELLSSDIAKLTLACDNGGKPNYLPGQYAKIEIPGTKQTRSFSFSCAAPDDFVEFVLRLLPSGLASNYFRDGAQVGDKLKLAGPFGSFYLRQVQVPILFFAGGTGIAPFLAMLDTLAAETAAVPHPITLFYGATRDENAVELQRLESYKASLPFDYHVCISGEASRRFAEGFVTQWIKKKRLGEGAYEAYVCGPPPMVDAVKASLAEERISLTNFFTEKFIPTGAA
jgi:benzoate/toluate 1,2-dioxygenase reductase subunit